MLAKEEFEQIFNTHYNSLCKYLFLFTSDFAAIEDIVQSVFIKLWEDREKVLTENVKAYLFIAVRNRALNAIRDSRRRDEILEEFYTNELINENAEDIIDMNEFYDLVQKSVDLLSEKTKEVYLLSREHKLSYKEIAARQNISVKTVENHIGNALKRINENLKSYYEILLALIFLIKNNFFS